MKLRKLIFTVIVIFAVAACPMNSFAAGASPGEAASELVEAIRGWDAVTASAALDEVIPAGYGELIGGMILSPLLGRLDYTVRNEKITGRMAEVDIAVTAANVKDIAGEIAAEAIGFAALKQLTGLPLDVETYVARRISSALEDGSLTTIKIETTAYFIQGGDASWNLDMTDPRNLDFLKALTGGFVNFEEPLQAILSGEAPSG